MTDRETDSFIREVTEEVRQDRMLIYWRRYGLYVIGGILSIVGLAAAWAWYQAAQTAAARERGAAFLALDPEDHAAAAALAGELEGDAGTLAGFAEAAALARAGEVEAAVAKYQSLSGAGAPRYTDLATLEAVRLRADAGEAPSDLLLALEPIAEPGRPYRPLALELRAAIRLGVGETDAARQDIDAAMADPAVTRETRDRLREIRTVLGQ